MPITEDRMLRLLVAGEDAFEALTKAVGLVAASAKRALEEGTPGASTLDELALMCQIEMLLAQPVQTELTLSQERSHWTEGRIKANERHRRKREKKYERTHSDD